MKRGESEDAHQQLTAGLDRISDDLQRLGLLSSKSSSKGGSETKEGVPNIQLDITPVNRRAYPCRIPRARTRVTRHRTCGKGCQRSIRCRISFRPASAARTRGHGGPSQLWIAFRPEQSELEMFCVFYSYIHRVIWSPSVITQRTTVLPLPSKPGMFCRIRRNLERTSLSTSSPR